MHPIRDSVYPIEHRVKPTSDPDGVVQHNQSQISGVARLEDTQGVSLINMGASQIG